MRQSNLAPRAPTHLGFKATVGAIFGYFAAYGLGFADPLCLIAAGLAAISIRIALIDLKRRIILDRDLIAMATIGVAWLLWADSSSSQISNLCDALLRMFAYGVITHSIKVLYFRLRARNGMGIGDVKIIFVSGLFVYLSFFYLMLLLSCFLSAIYVVFIIHKKRSRSTRYMYVPFGAMVSTSILITWIVQSLYY